MKVWLLAALAIASCAFVAPPPRSRFGPLVARIPNPRGEALDSVPGVYAALDLLEGAPYDPQVLGVGGISISLRLTSVALRPVRVLPLRLTLAATHDGQSFPCREHDSQQTPSFEPVWLELGDSFAFERQVDCTTPMSGIYEVRVFARVGEHPAASSAGDYVGTFELEVEGVSPPPARPRPPDSAPPH